MTSDRPYESAVPQHQALAELRGCAATQFDPAVVAVLCAEIERQASARPVRDATQDAPDPTPLDPTLDADLAGDFAPAPEGD